MPQKIYLIRHGETNHNLNGIVQGWLDVPLNKQGLKQAKFLAERLKDTAIDYIYSSDLKRAVQTAQQLAKLKHLKVITTTDLRERHLGIFEGKSWQELSLKHPDILDKFRANQFNPDWNEINGESFGQLGIRIKNFIDHLTTKHQNENVAVFTHGGAKLNLLYNLGFVKESQDIHLGNTSLTTIVNKGGKYYLATHNDTSHLEK